MPFRPTKLNTQSFVERCNELHNGKYDYSNVNYTTCKDKVEISCPIHGAFLISPMKHMCTKNPSGCTQCGHDKKKKTLDKFISDAIAKHGNKYDYSKVEYINGTTEVTIICPVHGETRNTPRKHLKNSGCNQCGKADNKYNTWTHSGWKSYGEQSKFFDSYKVYVLKCNGNNEFFYKIGKTFTSVKRRYYGTNSIFYLYEVEREINGSPGEISLLEEYLHKKFKKNKYIPLITFPGFDECYDLSIDLDGEIKNYFKNSK